MKNKTKELINAINNSDMPSEVKLELIKRLKNGDIENVIRIVLNYINITAEIINNFKF